MKCRSEYATEHFKCSSKLLFISQLILLYPFGQFTEFKMYRICGSLLSSSNLLFEYSALYGAFLRISNFLICYCKLFLSILLITHYLPIPFLCWSELHISKYVTVHKSKGISPVILYKPLINYVPSMIQNIII